MDPCVGPQRNAVNKQHTALEAKRNRRKKSSLRCIQIFIAPGDMLDLVVDLGVGFRSNYIYNA